MTTARTRWRPPLALTLLGAVLLALLTWGVYYRWPQTVHLSGESVTTTPEFSLRGGRYGVQAELLPECQYTFYLTPAGGLWNRSGRAVAASSGERAVSGQTDPVAAGRYFVYAYTAPEEGCSWSLALRPLP